MAEVQGQGRESTVLLITHSIPEAVFPADRVPITTEWSGAIVAVALN